MCPSEGQLEKGISSIKKIDSSSDNFLLRTVLPETCLKNETKEFNRICRKSNTFAEFVGLYLTSDVFKNSQGAYVLFRKIYPQRYWYKLRSFLGDNCNKSLSDSGSLKIGNDDFALFIGNGYGDGITRYAIFDYEPEWADWFGHVQEYFSVKKDDSIFVYSYDCGDESSRTGISLSVGSYCARAYDGLVLITKCS